ncbi:hypothetical protein D3C72_580460 [compost metagenome]
MTQTKETRTTVRLMKALTGLISVMSAKELSSLAGELEKRVAAAKSANAKPATAEPQPQRGELVEKAIEAIKASQSRDEGYKVLDELRPTRRELADMAGRFDVYVTKEDNTSRLIEKVIGAAIGSRLSSIAIRGEAFDGAPPKD